MFLIIFTFVLCVILFYVIKSFLPTVIPQPWACPYFKHYPYFYYNGDDVDTYAKLSKPFYKYGLFKCDILTVPEHIVLLDPEYPKHVFSKPTKFKRADTIAKFCPFMLKSIFMARGDEHKWQKKLLSGLFTAERHLYYINVMNKHAHQLSELIKGELNSCDIIGKNFEVLPMFNKLSFGIIADAAFNYNASEDKYRFVELCEILLLSSNDKMYLLTNLFPILKCLPFGFTKRRTIALEETRIYVEKMLRERREEKLKGTLTEEKKQDFLSWMIETKLDNRAMDDETICHNIFQFLIAGFETTSTTLMWVSYALGVYPEMQKKARAEVMSIVETEGIIDNDKIRQLTYLDKFIKEVLRYYNSSIRIGRVAVEDCKIGNYNIPKGHMIKTVLSLFHMNERLHPEAETFKPERFEDEELTKNGSWLAFGYGPYMCMGRHFAMNEIKITMATLLKKYSFEVDAENRSYKRAIRIAVVPVPLLQVRIRELNGNE